MGNDHRRRRVLPVEADGLVAELVLGFYARRVEAILEVLEVGWDFVPEALSGADAVALAVAHLVIP
jgi:hypothetical protein